MLYKQHVFSAIVLIYVPFLVWLVRGQIIDLALDIGFSREKSRTQKRLKRHLKKETILDRLFLMSFLKETDQNRWKIWIGILWWWFTLLIAFIETAIALCGFVFSTFFSTKLLTLVLVTPMWLFAVALAFDSFVCPSHRKDPGISTFECGFITLGVLGSGIIYLILNFLDLW